MHVGEKFAQWLERWWLARMLDKVAPFAILVTLVTLFFEGPQRHADRLAAAWQVVRSAHDQRAEGGRVEALEFLNENATDLSGLEAEHEMLSGVSLQGALLRGADLDSTTLKCADLSDANLWRANLQRADLSLTDFRGAILAGADLSKSNLFGAHLETADLEGARLDSATFDSSNVGAIVRAGYEIDEVQAGDRGDRIVLPRRTRTHSVQEDSPRDVTSLDRRKGSSGPAVRLSDSSYLRDSAFVDRFLDRRRVAERQLRAATFWWAWVLNIHSHRPSSSFNRFCLMRAHTRRGRSP